MMQEAKYDNDTHPIMATNSSNTQRQRDKRKVSEDPVLGRHNRHHQRSSPWEGANLHQHLHQHHILSNPSSSLVSNSCL